MRETCLSIESNMKFKLALIGIIFILGACASDETKQETQPVNLEATVEAMVLERQSEQGMPTSYPSFGWIFM